MVFISFSWSGYKPSVGCSIRRSVDKSMGRLDNNYKLFPKFKNMYRYAWTIILHEQSMFLSKSCYCSKNKKSIKHLNRKYHFVYKLYSDLLCIQVYLFELKIWRLTSYIFIIFLGHTP